MWAQDDPAPHVGEDARHEVVHARRRSPARGKYGEEAEVEQCDPWRAAGDCWESQRPIPCKRVVEIDSNLGHLAFANPSVKSQSYFKFQEKCEREVL